MSPDHLSLKCPSARIMAMKMNDREGWLGFDLPDKHFVWLCCFVLILSRKQLKFNQEKQVNEVKINVQYNRLCDDVIIKS